MTLRAIGRRLALVRILDDEGKDVVKSKNGKPIISYMPRWLVNRDTATGRAAGRVK